MLPAYSTYCFPYYAKLRNLLSVHPYTQTFISSLLVQHIVLLFLYIITNKQFCHKKTMIVWQTWTSDPLSFGLAQNSDFKTLTCGLCSFQRLTAFLSNHWVNVDQVLCERIESPEDHGGHSPIHKHLRKKCRLRYFLPEKLKCRFSFYCDGATLIY